MIGEPIKPGDIVRVDMTSTRLYFEVEGQVVRVEPDGTTIDMQLMSCGGGVVSRHPGRFKFRFNRVYKPVKPWGRADED